MNDHVREQVAQDILNWLHSREERSDWIATAITDANAARDLAAYLLRTP